MRRIKLDTVLFEQKESIKQANGDNLPLIGVSNKNGLGLSRAKRIADLSRYKLIEKGWFAYNPMRINVGSIGYAYEDEHVGVVSPDYVIFSCSNEILPEYLLFILKSDEGIEAINKNASGTVRKRLYFSDLANIEILLPSLDSQKRRLEAFKKISVLNNKIEEETQKDNLLNQLRQAILQKALQGKLTEEWRKQNPELISGENSSERLLQRIKKEKKQLISKKKTKKEKPLSPIGEKEMPFKLPKDWIWCRLDEIISFQIGRTPASKRSDYWINGKYNWLSISEMNDFGTIEYTAKKITEKAKKESFKNREMVPVGTILMSFKLTVGKISINKIPLYHNEAIISIYPYKEISKEFLFHFLPLAIKYSASKSVLMGQTFNSKSLGKILLPLPSIEEQKIIVQKVKILISKCEVLKNRIEVSQTNAHQLMQAILKEAFSSKEEGKTQTNDAELQLALIQHQIKNRFGINYGEVAAQKTVFHINYFTNQEISYQFINSNYGTYSPELKKDLTSNTFLTKTKQVKGSVFQVKQTKEKEILDKASLPENKALIVAINEVLDIYELPFINKETDKIELLNTVSKLILDLNTTNIEKIYPAMQDWTIKQTKFATKADKFSKANVSKMIKLICNLGLDKKLISL